MLSVFRLSSFVLAFLAGLLAACGVGPTPESPQATAEAGLTNMLATIQAQATFDAPTPAPGSASTGAYSDLPISRTPAHPRIRLTTSLDTVYYAVDGRTITEIFESLKTNGPTSGFETSERFTTGLTEAVHSFEYVLSRGLLRCEVESVDITLNLVVTLPRHSHPDGLTPDLLSRWQALEADVAGHEQRHVDIHINKMEEFERNLADDYPLRYSDCDQLKRTLTLRWGAATLAADSGQIEFHASEEQRSRSLRGPVQTRIDEAEAELARLQDKLDRGSSTSAQLRTQITAQEESTAVYQSQMDAIQALYPDLVLPSDVFDTYEVLRAQWSDHNDLRNQLIDELNQAVRSHNQTVEAFNRLASDISELQEELAWLP